MNSLNCSGFCSFNNTSMPSFTGTGTTELDHITCKNSVTNAGSLLAKNCNLEKIKSAGSSVLQKSISKDFRGSGRTDLIECNLGSVQTSGRLHIQDSNIKQIRHTGRLKIVNSTIQNVSHSGRIEVANSRIQNTLESCAKSINIYNSQIKKILVLPPQNNSGLKIFGFDLFSSFTAPESQIVELVGKNCNIESIVFEKGCNAQVVKKDGAVVKRISRIQ